jgi:hypothetical protein
MLAERTHKAQCTVTDTIRSRSWWFILFPKILITFLFWWSFFSQTGEEAFMICLLSEFRHFRKQVLLHNKVECTKLWGGLHNITATYREGPPFESRPTDQLLSPKASIHPSFRRRMSWDALCSYYCSVILHPINVMLSYPSIRRYKDSVIDSVFKKPQIN